jgi:hypothetical protein
MLPGQRHHGRTAREACAVGDLGDGAHLCVDALMARHEQHAALAARVERERHCHVRKDDCVVQRDKEVLLHVPVHAPELMYYSE